MANDQQFVVFRVGAQLYALPVVPEASGVREIVRPPEITAVPQAPEYVAGVINLRGRIVPVIDLRKRFGQPEETSSKNRILVLTRNGTLLGALVDSASEVLKLDPTQIEPNPKLFAESAETYVSGIAKHAGRLLVMLDPERLLPHIDSAEPTIA